MRPSFATAIRFLLGGVANTSITFALYWMLLVFVKYQVAYAISFTSGILVSYLINTGFVFRTSHSLRKILTFPVIYLTSYLVGAMVLHLSVAKIGVDPRLGPLISICVTLPLTFILLKLTLTDKRGSAG